MSAPTLPDLAGHFGRFGGRFVPEALVKALDELDAAYREAKTDPVFQARFTDLLVNYAGTPSLLYRAERLSAAIGAEVLLKREDLNHTGAHKVRNVLGQALLAKKMGKPRVIAETGAGQHGVASATAAALLDLECVVYMGEVDTERQALNVARMRMLGATVVPVTTGSRTLKDALNEALRDWVSSVDTTHYLLGTAAGPHPFPEIVRDFVGGIGIEARAQCLDQLGRLPDAVAACVGGGSNAIGIFHAFVPDEGVRALRLRGRRRRRGDRPARRVDHRRLGGRAARRADVRAAGRGRADGRVALHLGRPGLPGRRARSTPGCTTPAGRSTSRSPTPRRWPRSSCSAAPRASSRRSRARTRWPASPGSSPQLTAELGRTPTDRDQPVRPRRQGRAHRGRVLRHPGRAGSIVPGENA